MNLKQCDECSIFINYNVPFYFVTVFFSGQCHGITGPSSHLVTQNYGLNFSQNSTTPLNDLTPTGTPPAKVQ